MSCVVSISDKPEGIWSVRSSVYENFVTDMLRRSGSESRVADCLKRSLYFQALDLGSLRAKDPEFACEVIDALVVACREVSADRSVSLSERAHLCVEWQDEAEVAFANLAELLMRFRQSITSPSFGEKG